MTTTTALLSELQQRAGPGAVRHRTEDVAGCAVAGVAPVAVVAPADAAGVAAVLALCSDAGVPVEAAGGCTWLSAGAAPPRPPVVVSTRRLSAVVDYEPADLVAGMQAGMTLGGLERELAAHGQMLPLDPPARDGATIGATVSLASAGPLRAAYGTPRDMVLGIEIATGDGRLLRFGGRVVKNVAGYDFVRLATGSRGSLGIITSLYALLRSSPEVDRTLVVPAGTEPAGAAALALAVRERTEADAIELLAPGVAAGVPGDVPPGAWLLAVRVRGNGAGVADVADRLAALQPAARSLPDEAAAAFWRRLAASEADAAVALRLGGAPASLGDTLAMALALVAAGSGAVADGAWRIAAHAANGIVRLWRPRDVAPLDAAAWGAALDSHGAAHLERGGSLIWEALPPDLEGLRREPEPADAGAAALMRGIAQRFDPAGIMASGRRGFR